MTLVFDKENIFVHLPTENFESFESAEPFLLLGILYMIFKVRQEGQRCSCVRTRASVRGMKAPEEESHLMYNARSI
jgi:hypothetical protein